MALLDIFKKKGEKKPIKKEVKKSEAKKEKPQPKKDEVIKAQEPAHKKKASGNAYRILFSPHITEKATALTEENKYVFKVWPKANKNEIKKAVEGLYGVDVVSVRVLNVPEKQVRVGGHIGWKKGYKKAIVSVKKGQKIEILPR
jgi:large subunit ribosomal protein L23